jgi:hypothetical protein
MVMNAKESVTPVNPPRRASTGVQKIQSELKRLDSGACPGPDPGFAGMTEKTVFDFLRSH